jgi:NhaP-type Na+/H+ or K+/H+ antiporter
MILVAVFLALVLLFSLVSKRAEQSIVTGPMVFTIVGILVFLAAPHLAAIELTNPILLVVAEITLALVLFCDATRLSPRRVMRETQLPARLLAIAMPLTVAASTLAAVLLISDAPVWEAAILATVLAPTDASLGAAVVQSKLVPERIREALEVESGLNDGLSMPFLVLFIALAGVELHAEGHFPWLVFTVKQIGLGVLVGLGLGLLGGWLMTRAEQRDWMAGKARQLAMLALAVLAWWLANHVLGGNGFIAAFVAGSALRFSYEKAHQHMAHFEEAWGDLLLYFVFFAFGLIAGRGLPGITGVIWLYALLSLTVVRMLPVAISMIGTKLQPASVLFMGWFGPRGLASVVLGMIYLEEVASIDANSNIVLAMIATVLLSVLAHGLSANPGVKLYSSRIAKLDSDAPEYAEIGANR